jgi:uncharacterized BrkB/YihY/UPF0761 family membrane protein
VIIAVIAMFFIVLLAMPLYCVIDAAMRSSRAFESADSNKTLWIVLPLVFGFIAAIVYLVAVRPKVIMTGKQL